MPRPTFPAAPTKPPAAPDPAFIAGLRREMLAFAQLQLRDAALAEDAVQEALAAALTNASQFAGQAAIKTWVFAILRHKIVDGIRQQARTTPISALSDDEMHLDEAFDALFKANAHWQPGMQPAAWGNPEQALHDKHFWDVFDACLTHLPENTARVFMMREFLDLETPEICLQLNISTSNCHVILHRARAALRGCLEKSWFLAGERPC